MDRKTIDKLTHLSKLSIPENDVDELIINLENILKLIGEIDAAPTEGMEPMAHPLDFNQPLREDRPIKDSIDQKIKMIHLKRKMVIT